MRTDSPRVPEQRLWLALVFPAPRFRLLDLDSHEGAEKGGDVHCDDDSRVQRYVIDRDQRRRSATVAHSFFVCPLDSRRFGNAKRPVAL